MPDNISSSTPQTCPLTTLPRCETPSENDTVLALVQEDSDTQPHAALIPRSALSRGQKGDPGLSAYQLAVSQGFTGSLNDWLNDLKGSSDTHATQGEKGEQGPTGPQGPQGMEGPVGPRGLQGEKGDPGPAGPAGLQASLGSITNTSDTGVIATFFRITRDGGANNIEEIPYPNGLSFQVPPFVDLVTHIVPPSWDGSQITPLSSTTNTTSGGPRILSVGRKTFRFQHPFGWPGNASEATSFIIWGIPETTSTGTPS